MPAAMPRLPRPTRQAARSCSAASRAWSLALWIAPRRVAMPLAAAASPGSATFVRSALAGLSVIERYLLVPSLVMLIFAAVAVGGWTMLRARRGCAPRLGAGGGGARGRSGSCFTAHARRASTASTTSCAFRGDAARRAWCALLDEPAGARGLRCGPLSVPNHKLIPDSRWLLDLPREPRGRARADPARGAERTARAAWRSFVHRAPRSSRQALQPTTDDPPRSRCRRRLPADRDRATTTRPMSAAEPRRPPAGR